VYGVNGYAAGYGSWSYPGYVFRTPSYYYTSPTTYLYLPSTGFSGGFYPMDPELPASDPPSKPAQPVVLPIQK
jgi:hypothetical protein